MQRLEILIPNENGDGSIPFLRNFMITSKNVIHASADKPKVYQDVKYTLLSILVNYYTSFGVSIHTAD